MRSRTGLQYRRSGPNNEGLPSAEVVEGRTPLKGNGGQTAAVRTQRRGAASNGLTAVRFEGLRSPLSGRLVNMATVHFPTANIELPGTGSDPSSIRRSLPSWSGSRRNTQQLQY